MKRVGILLLTTVALLLVFTLALAQLEAKSAKNLLRAMSGEDVRGYFGTAVEAPFAYRGKTPVYAVSACGEVSGPVRSGRVSFYDNLLTSESTYELVAPAEGELYGATLSGGGDCNGDGIPDLAVGAPGEAAGAKTTAGKVYLYLGGEDFDSAAPVVLSAGESGDRFGDAIGLKHDINGDTLADLIVGAPRSSKAGATAGRAYVWFGRRDGSFPKNPDAEIRLGTTNDMFGSSVQTGDVSGDGQADLIIGAPQHNVGEKIPGSVFIFFGGKTVNLAAASQVISGESTSFQDLFGRSIAVVGDQNGDGINELLIGAPQVTIGGKQVGKIYIYNGGKRLTPAETFFVGSAEAGRFGQAVFALGDLNHDQKGDWAVQAESEAGGRGVLNFYYAGWERAFYRFTGEGSGDRLGGCLAVLGNVMDSETAAVDVIVGAPWNDSEGENSGRAYLLRFE